MSPGLIFEHFTVCLQLLKESNKTRFDSYSQKNNVYCFIISHITSQDCRMHIFPTTFLKIIICMLQFEIGTLRLKCTFNLALIHE